MSHKNFFAFTRRFLVLAAAFCVQSNLSHAEENSDTDKEANILKGKVTRVIDGDSIVVKSDKEEETIHLEGIDAPEFKQDGGKDSTDFLKKLVNGKEVEVRWENRDNYKRILGTVFVGDDKNVNLEMISKGWAWHYEQYSKSDQYAAAQKEAKEGKLGIWKKEEPTAPWDFRKDERNKDKKDSDE